MQFFPLINRLVVQSLSPYHPLGMMNDRRKIAYLDLFYHAMLGIRHRVDSLSATLAA
jgi:hypothetical protein